MCREHDFLKKIHDAVDRGGKVLIPVFALGRVQELCILLDTYWDRMNLKVPIYFTMGLAETVSTKFALSFVYTSNISVCLLPVCLPIYVISEIVDDASITRPFII